MTARQAVLAGCAALCLAGVGSGDIVVHGPDMAEGFIRTDDAADPVQINIYWSTHPNACFGNVSVPKRQVARLVRQRRPPDEYFDHAFAAKPEDGAAQAACAEWCKKTGRRDEADWHARLALAADPSNAAATKLLGAGRAKKLVAEEAEWTGKTLPALRELCAAESPDARAACKGSVKGLARAPSELAVDRLFRSAHARKGLHEDLQLRMDVGELKRCIYTLFVPDDYDPLRTYPLILGLHGGGPGPDADADPVGSGKETMPFYLHDARKRKYIIVCPDAIKAGWSTPPNTEWIDKLLREIVLTYHIDLRRVYVMGHSMGGWGTWYHGPRLADSIAAFSPNSGGGPGGYDKIKKTQTAVYQYHGTDDNRCQVGASQSAAKSLKQNGCDFIYTELPAPAGHSWPKECISAAFDLFDRRRTFPTGEPTVFFDYRLPKGVDPVSSLAVLPLTKVEVTDLGGIEIGKKGASDAGPSWKDLVTQLTKGGELADEAAEALGAHAERSKAVKAVVGLLGHEKEDTRRSAATALGLIGDPTALRPLAEAAKEEQRPVRRAAVRAIGRISGAEALPLLKGLVEWQGTWFDGIAPSGRLRADNWQWNQQEVAMLFDALAPEDGRAPVVDAATLAAIDRVVLTGMILRELDVAWDKVAHKDPEVTRALYAESLAVFVGRARRPEGAALLDRLVADGRFTGRPKVVAAIDAARAALAARPPVPSK